jgi:hypothetical protein
MAGRLSPMINRCRPSALTPFRENTMNPRLSRTSISLESPCDAADADDS